MMSRVRVDPRYLKSARKITAREKRQANSSLEKFLEDPARPGLNFEPIVGFPDYFTIRVNRSLRILLRREEDKDGELFAAVDIGSHDVVYRRR